MRFLFSFLLLILSPQLFAQSMAPVIYEQMKNDFSTQWEQNKRIEVEGLQSVFKGLDPSSLNICALHFEGEAKKILKPQLAQAPEQLIQCDAEKSKQIFANIKPHQCVVFALRAVGEGELDFALTVRKAGTDPAQEEAEELLDTTNDPQPLFWACNPLSEELTLEPLLAWEGNQKMTIALILRQDFSDEKLKDIEAQKEAYYKKFLEQLKKERIENPQNELLFRLWNVDTQHLSRIIQESKAKFDFSENALSKQPVCSLDIGTHYVAGSDHFVEAQVSVRNQPGVTQACGDKDVSQLLAPIEPGQCALFMAITQGLTEDSEYDIDMIGIKGVGPKNNAPDVSVVVQMMTTPDALGYSYDVSKDGSPSVFICNTTDPKKKKKEKVYLYLKNNTDFSKPSKAVITRLNVKKP